MQPGDTITPGAQPPSSDEQPAASQAQEVAKAAEQSQVIEQPAPAPENPEINQSPVSTPNADENNSVNWQFNPEPTQEASNQKLAVSSQPITWTASEYVSHDKNVMWFLYVMVAVAALSGLIYLITRELVSSAVIFVVGIAFSAFAARPPRVLSYSISINGLTIDQKQYPYSSFRSFSVIQDGAVRSIILMPLQRFGLPIMVYFDPSDEQKIVETLGGHLPYEERRASPIDNFMRKIRF